MCFEKSDTFGLVGLLRSFLPLVLGLMCAYRSLLLALVLSSLSHASQFEGDVSVMFLRGLVKAIFLFEGVKKGVFLAVNCIISGLWFSVVNY